LEQIDRARRLVDTVPGEQRPMFQALLVQTQVQRDAIQAELDTLGERLKQTERRQVNQPAIGLVEPVQSP
jgi:hypothetical protein